MKAARKKAERVRSGYPTEGRTPMTPGELWIETRCYLKIITGAEQDASN